MAKIRVHVDPDLKEIVPGFLENRKKDVLALANALQTQDFATCKSIGHKMNGNSGGYGFHRLSEIGEVIEKASANNNLYKIQSATRELESYLANLEVVYDSSAA